METLAKRLAALILLGLFIVLMLMTFASCGARKKKKDSRVYIEQVESKDMKNLILNSERESQEALQSIKRVEATSEIGKFSGTVADPLLPATVEEETKEGKTIRTYRNFINVNTEDESSRQQTFDSLVQSNTEKEKTIAELQQKLEQSQKLKTEDKSLDVAVKRGFPWWVLIVIAIIYFIISYFKGWNPLRWILKRPSI
ncbi:MAG TPA: hypothetical protein PKH16_09905 [Aequorivita sp.]|nr:hypothetical protein [Aequorivita sp.]